MNEKDSLRRALRGRRQTVAAGARREGSRRVARRGRFFLRHACHVGAYLPHGSELDIRPLMQALMRLGCHIYLPTIVRRRPDSALVFSLWRPPLHPGLYGIIEPRWGRKRPGRALDAVLVPLVGFDSQGWRLGQGGGHYDRTFAFLSGKPRMRPALVGVAFECQRVASLPKEAHDVRLHAVLTEKRLYRLRRMPS